MRFSRRPSSFAALRRADPRLAACIVLAVAAIAIVSANCNDSDSTNDDVASPTAHRDDRTAAPSAGRSPAPTPATDCGVPAALPAVFCTDVTTMEYGEVTGIVDGDTFDVLIQGREERIRFFGIDTPERGEPCFSEATESARQLISDNVRLLPDDRNRDRNGRLLRYVYTPTGLSIDAALIANGYAHAWTTDGQHRDALVTLEADARTARRGCLWQ